MCGRYSLFFDDEYDYDIAKMMDILKQNYPQTKVKQGEIYPTNTAPVLVKQNSEIAPVPYSWGFPNFRSKGVIINARAETAEGYKNGSPIPTERLQFCIVCLRLWSIMPYKNTVNMIAHNSATVHP